MADCEDFRGLGSFPKEASAGYRHDRCGTNAWRTVSNNVPMRVCCLVALVCLVLLGSRSALTVVAPDIVYGTFLGGRHKECATAKFDRQETLTRSCFE